MQRWQVLVDRYEIAQGGMNDLTEDRSRENDVGDGRILVGIETARGLMRLRG